MYLIMKRNFLILVCLFVAFIIALTIDFGHNTNQNELTIKNINMIKAHANVPEGTVVLCCQTTFSRCLIDNIEFGGYYGLAL